MDKGYRIVFKTYGIEDPNSIVDRVLIMEDTLSIPSDCLNFGMAHEQQIALIQSAQDKVISEKASLLNTSNTNCPECSGHLKKRGKQCSTYHDVFTDHQVKIQRLKCDICGYEAPATVRTLLDSSLSGALAKLQSGLGATHTFRDSESLFKLFSTKARSINNHNRIKNVTHSIGATIKTIDEKEKELLRPDEAKELIVNVDGSHVKTIEDQRSIEVLASVVYRPESLIRNSTSTRNHLQSKGCAASVKDDNQKEIISNTIIAALKQGLTPQTQITALCDGAANCWNVIDSLKPLSAGITYILDWFHITMKMQNIAIPKQLKNKFLRIKWHLWRGNTEAAIVRLKQLVKSADSGKTVEKIKKFQQYIGNNMSRIVNYRQRKKQGLVFTSNLAESTVESLINQRCKGQQHMRWSREGLNPILQLRAKTHSQDWEQKWKTIVLNAAL